MIDVGPSSWILNSVLLWDGTEGEVHVYFWLAENMAQSLHPLPPHESFYLFVLIM